MIKNIIFDVNKVLRILKNETLDKYLSKKQLTLYGEKYKKIWIKDYLKSYFNNAIFNQFDLGIISTENLVERLSEYYGEPKEVLESFMAQRCKKKHNIIFKPMIKFIKELKKHNYKVYILSNMGKDAAYALTKMLGKNNFDDIIYSCDVHMCKPSKEIFSYAFERFKINAEESLFIDDTKANLDAFETFNGFTYLFDYKSIDTAITDIKNIINKNKTGS